MVKLRLTFLVVALFAVIGKVNAQNPELVEEYINRYRELAMAEQMRVGIPAAVTLAQGIHETGAGTSRLAKLGNNHFGIKCKRTWKGQTIKHTDDAPNECFRKYDDPLESYKDHSNYLRNNPRYASLFKLSITDYAAWCIGLRRAGYATNPRYAQMLIKLIENYKLQEYTYQAMSDNSFSDKYVETREDEIIPEHDPVVKPVAPVTASTAPTMTTVPVVTERVSSSGMKVEEQRTVAVNQHPIYGKPVKVNGLRAVYGKEGQSPLEYAIRNSIRYKKFLELNDLNEGVLKEDMYLYLERKHFRGVRPMHMVKPEETIHAIAQKEGIQLKYLLELNNMVMGEEPVPGVVLELQNKAKEKPRVYEKPQEETIPVNSSQSTSYVKTNKSPIPTNPRYVAPSTTSNPNSAIKVTTTAPVQESVQSDAFVQESKATNTDLKMTTSKEDKNIKELKQKFDNVIYNKENKSTIPTNPRYVPATNTPQVTTADMKTISVKNSTPATTTPQVVSKVEPVALSDQEDKDIKELKEKFDNVIYDNDVKTSKETTINYVPKANKTEVKNNVGQKKEIMKPEIVSNTNPVVDETVVAANIPVVETGFTKVNPVKKTTVVPIKEDIGKKETKANDSKSELDKLKAQFDAVVYENTKTATIVTSKNDEKADVESAKDAMKLPLEDKEGVADSSKYYTVKEGDTAFSIAKENGITMRELMDWNNLDFDTIKIGMKLLVKK